MKEDLTGRVFSRLTVLGFWKSTRNGAMWNCQCECGQLRVVRGAQLKSGKSKSCGCIQQQPTRDAILVRLREFYDVGQQGCWEWKGWLDEHGYGRFRLNRRQQLAHRASYQLLVGEIPDGLQLDHLCRNRKCVNPSHLEPVTTQENTARGMVATKTHCKHGHEFTPENTYVNAAGNRYCRTCKRRRFKNWYDANYQPKGPSHETDV